MADLLFSIDVSGSGARAPQAFAAVAEALSRHDVDHVLTYAHRAGASWLPQRAADPIRVGGVARYSAALDDSVETLVGAVAPDAVVTVEWDAVTGEQAAAAPIGPAVYRLAELFTPGEVPATVGRALVTNPVDPAQEFYDAMGAAHLIVGVDWKSTRTEAADAIGALRVPPDGGRTVASSVPDFASLRAGWASDDEAGYGDDDTRPYEVVAEALSAALLPDVLLVLDNGDTPGFVLVAPGLAAEVVVRARAAHIPLDRYG
jgi:hypothetical protein